MAQASGRARERELSASPLKATVDAFNGVRVDCAALGEIMGGGGASFGGLLRESLAVWATEGRTGAWLLIEKSQSALISAAVAEGFDFHHAKPGVVAMTKWLLEDTPNMIPAYPFTQVGVGAVIFDEAEKQILTVVEKNGPLRGKGVWKIPTGMAEPGEHIGAACEREVWEETGLKARFEKLLLFRHRLGGTCDLFFVCALKLDGEKRQQIIVDSKELEDAKFMNIRDYFSQKIWSEIKVYKDHINPAILSYTGCSDRVGLAHHVREDERYGKHAVYMAPTRAVAAAAPAGRPQAGLRPPSLLRPIRSSLTFLRRLVRL